MFETLKLLIPVFIPSWKFFNVIAPSPRIEYVLLPGVEKQPDDWQEFSFRPQKRSITAIAKSIFYNPDWNEALFMMNCAERLIINPTQHSSDEIVKRIKTRLEKSGTDLSATPYLQFRLVFLSRDGGSLQKDILFHSELTEIGGGADS